MQDCLKMWAPFSLRPFVTPHNTFWDYLGYLLRRNQNNFIIIEVHVKGLIHDKYFEYTSRSYHLQLLHMVL